MDETLFLITLIAWVLSGFAGAGWLMLKGYTTEMLGCLRVLYGGVLTLIALFGPIMLVIAWALPSRTDPTQQGGVKKLLTPKPERKSLPKPAARSGAPPKPAARAPVSRRPKISGDTGSSRRAMPPGRAAGGRRRPQPPMRR